MFDDNHDNAAGYRVDPAFDAFLLLTVVETAFVSMTAHKITLLVVLLLSF